MTQRLVNLQEFDRAERMAESMFAEGVLAANAVKDTARVMAREAVSSFLVHHKEDPERAEKELEDVIASSLSFILVYGAFEKAMEKL